MRFYPVSRDFVVTSGFGPRWGTIHRGIDLGKPGGSGGSPVYAAQSGRVQYAGAASGFGGSSPRGWVVIDHPSTSGSGTTVYGHVVAEVSPGDWVEAGQRIATINPDKATNGGVDPHLHFEVHPTVWRAGSQLDPDSWLRGSLYNGESNVTLPSPTPRTIWGVDISNHQKGINVQSIRNEGFDFLIAKVSEGSTYRDPQWPGFRDAARAAGLKLMGYHYFRTGNVQAQADTFVQHLGDKSIPAMIDFENGSGTSVRSIVEFIAALRDRGVTAKLLYLPRWYWQGTMGSTDLSPVGLPLMSSSYGANRAGYTSAIYPGDNDPGWNGYGGLDVAVFQFSERGRVAGMDIDVNAFKGTEADLAALFSPEEDDDMAFTDEDRAMLRTVHAELTKRFPSRSKYRADNGLVDTLAGLMLNVDARVHEMSVESEAANNASWAVNLVRREADRGDEGAKAILARLGV